MRVAEVICKKIQLEGTKHIFGYSGGANLPLLDEIYKINNNAIRNRSENMDSFQRNTDWHLWKNEVLKYGENNIRFITNSNEQCAAHAAVGYSKASKMTGVAFTTSGPGVTNSITALQDAMADSIPMVMISGQVKTSAIGTDAFQECPAIELTKPCTKWNYFLDNPNDTLDAISEAFKIANSGRRGPVHIDIPMDILTQTAIDNLEGDDALTQMCSHSDYEAGVGNLVHPSFNEVNIENIARKINRAKRPVIIAGRGVTLSGGAEILRDISFRGGIPITTTLHGLGCADETDAFSLEMIGMHGSYAANMAVQNADVIVAIGSRFDDRTTGILSKFAPNALSDGIIHINNDRTEINRVVNTEQYVIGDCREVMIELVDRIRGGYEVGVEYGCERKEWLNQIYEWKNQYPFDERSKLLPDTGKMETPHVIMALNDYINNSGLARDFSDYLFTTGVGNHQMMLAQYLKWRSPGAIITSGSLGVMGTGLPFAIGAQLANPGKTVVVVDGDGSFNMSLTDLKMLLEMKLPIKIILMNDCRMQMVYVWQKLLYDGRYIATETTNPDFLKIADAYDIMAIECSSKCDIKEKMNTFMSYDKGPILMVCNVEPGTCLPFVTPGSALDDMLLEPL